MRFGYNARPSFWQDVRSNSHLVIAAVGTAALLGVAAVALWLALPASERQAVAGPENIPTIQVKTTKITPTGNTVAAAVVPRVAPKSSKVSPAVAPAEVAIPALAANDPRWTGPQAKAAPAPASGPSSQPDKPAAAVAEAFTQSASDTDAAAELAKVGAPVTAAGDNPDGAQTAAIQAAQPQAQEQPAAAANDDGTGEAELSKMATASSGRILRAVTMRSSPKQNGAPMVTVPARSSVQVMSCQKWCQIVYNGKTGWVYKSFVKTGA